MKYKKEHDVAQERAFLVLCSALCIQWVLFIITEYHLETLIWQDTFFFLAYIIPSILLLRSFFILERIHLLSKKYIFSKIWFMLLVLCLFFLILNFEIAYFIAVTGFWVMLFSLFFAYTIHLIKERYRAKADTRYNIAVFAYILGGLLILLSYILSSEKMVDSLGLEIRYIGDIIQLIGLFVISIFFFSIPHLSEYDWKERVIEIYILLKSGIGICNKNFRGEVSQLHSKQHIAGGFKTMEIILKSITESPGGSVIESKGGYIIIEPGIFITGVIICEENLKSVRSILKKIVGKIETIYSETFKTLSVGTQSIFDPIEDIINEFLI